MLLQITSLRGTDLFKHCNENVICALLRNMHFQVNSKYKKREKAAFLKAFPDFSTPPFIQMKGGSDTWYRYPGVPPAQLIVQQ